MVSPRTPNIVQKRYGPSEGRNVMGMDVKQRFEIEGAGAGAGVGLGVGVGGQSEMYEYLRATKKGNEGGDGDGAWGDEQPTEEVFLQRALAAIKTANSRGDGVVEMEEREWQAWQLHEAMEREIEKRVAEREMEREMQRERDLARAEELQRELDMLRRSTRNPRDGGSGGEPGFLLDQSFSPLGGYASNSSSSSSLLAKAAGRPYAFATPPRRDARFMPDATDPLFAHNVRPVREPREMQSFPTPSLRPPAQPAPTSYPQPANPAAPRRSSSRSSSLTRESKSRHRSVTASTSVPPGADLAPGGSYHPGTHPSIPTSQSTGALGGKKSKRVESEAEEEVYTSSATTLKDARRRKRG